MTNRSTRTGNNAPRQRSKRIKKKRTWLQRIRSFFVLCFLILLSIAALGLVTLLIVFWQFSNDLPDIKGIYSDTKAPIATKIWSQDGVLLAMLEAPNHYPIAPADLGNSRVADATIAIEDHRFYEHKGVDVYGIGRAIVADMTGSRLKQGASTLTQQLVRQPAFQTQLRLSSDRTISRKIREALIALRVEQVYSKQDILLLYLNTVYYGGGAYGIQAASKSYFGKNVAKLNISESALLAGLPQSPVDFTPFRNMDKAMRRRDQVLDAMLEHNKISQQEHDKAVLFQPKIRPQPKHHNVIMRAPYFTSYVLKQLSESYDRDFLYSGLSIKTTINMKIQNMAEFALEEGLKSSDANQGALVCLDPKTGYIRAMIGGRDYKGDQFNAVTQGKRQPGSTFKLFDYAAAFDLGICDLNSTFMDIPIPYPNDPSHFVTNFGGGHSDGEVDVKNAIAFSKNTIAVQVAQKVTIRKVIAYAHKMGITNPLVPVLPTALGASEVHPLDLCSAYSIFANNGDRFHPMSIITVLDSEGTPVDPEKYVPHKEINVLKHSTIEMMDEALAAVVQIGTGKAAAVGIPEARGKSGTTSDARDAWFAGYTPQLTTVVWVANVQKHGKRKVYEGMGGTTGGGACAPIWNTFMTGAIPVQNEWNAKADKINAKVVKAAPPPDKNKIARKPKPVDPSLTVKPQIGATPDNNPAPLDSTGDNLTYAPEGTPNAQAIPGQNTPVSNITNHPPLGASSVPIRQPVESSEELPSSAIPLAGAPVRHSSPPSIAHTQSSAGSRLRVTAPTSPPPPPELVSVKVCGDTGDLANSYCDTYRTIRVTVAQRASMRKCRQHKPPPGT